MQTWHSLACAVKTEGKTVRVCGGGAKMLGGQSAEFLKSNQVLVVRESSDRLVHRLWGQTEHLGLRCIISGFRRGANRIFALLECYAA